MGWNTDIMEVTMLTRFTSHTCRMEIFEPPRQQQKEVNRIKADENKSVRQAVADVAD